MPNGEIIFHYSLQTAVTSYCWHNFKGCVNRAWVIGVGMCYIIKGEIASQLWEFNIVCKVNFRKDVVKWVPMSRNSVFDLLAYSVLSLLYLISLTLFFFFFILYFETGSYCVVLDNLELVI